MELTILTNISLVDLRLLDSFVLQTGDFKHGYKSQSDTILSCSIGDSLNQSGHVVYEWSEEGPVYGPNGELELDPDNQQCYSGSSSGYGYRRPAFATCNNNCPGGESSHLSSCCK